VRSRHGLIEAVPALLATFAVLYYLTDRPGLATWLEPDERDWLSARWLMRLHPYSP
jgi:hypothetical protein